ncbi:multidrug effflux MFS transporter [Paenirhodobacter populi]|uniref:multidrug effflux MFS transporter n=1 Tax=Paenirhodobacter populi TaxID=2306993 RepID=UPI000FE2C738|nr:Bcr/CflA family efflux MFS transporter [Sinirhodobacter populi]
MRYSLVDGIRPVQSKAMTATQAGQMPTETFHNAPTTERATAGVLALLMALTALGQLATNIVVPSLRDIARGVALPDESVGLILSMVLLGLAVGQLVVGPLSDRIGRRPVLIGGLAIYLLGSIGATFASDGLLLLAARLVQGLGASASLALPRAIARDRYTGPEFMRTMSLLTMAMAVTPGLAPVFGGLIADLANWRIALASTILAGAVALAAVTVSLPETHHQRTENGDLRAMLSAYAHVLRNRVFLAYALMSGAAIGGAYSEVSGAQQFYTGEFGWTPARLSLATACYAAAAFCGGILSRYIRASHRVRIGVGLIVAAPIVLLVLRGAGANHPAIMLGLIVVSQIGMGIMIGVAIGAALIALDRSVGTASAVLGAIHMTMGAAGAAIVTAIPTAASWSIPVTMLAFGLLAVLAQRIAARA